MSIVLQEIAKAALRSLGFSHQSGAKCLLLGVILLPAQLYAADGGSVRFVPADAKPRPADTAHEVYESYDRPYAGSCPPAPPAPDPVPGLR